MKNATTHRHEFVFEAYDSEGNLKWVEKVKNLVTNEGLNEIVDKFYKGSSYTADHYVGLIDGSPTVDATDTLASHSGWSEVTDYDESGRQSLVLGSVSSQSADNSASKAVFSINGSVTVGGGILTTVASGTSGILIGAVAFDAGDRSLQANDTLNVTITVSAASA